MIDARLVRELVRGQFPQWADLEVRAVIPSGWDHRSFRLGDRFVVRMPSEAAYAPQVEKEHRWLPHLAPHLPARIPKPVAHGVPGCGYPWNWSILEWIDGDTPSKPSPRLAEDLANFLSALHGVDTEGGPRPGPGNFHRGGNLGAYDDEVTRALSILEGRVDERAALRIWKQAIGTRWEAKGVWIHGDVSPGNLLTTGDRLVAMLDFGNLAVGDPACDVAIAWSWFDGRARDAYRTALPLNDDTWTRGRAWALWKALVVASGLSATNAVEFQDPMGVLANCLFSKS